MGADLEENKCHLMRHLLRVRLLHSLKEKGNCPSLVRGQGWLSHPRKFRRIYEIKILRFVYPNPIPGLRVLLFPWLWHRRSAKVARLDFFATVPLVTCLILDVVSYLVFPSPQEKAFVTVMPPEGQGYYHSTCYQQWDPYCLHISEKNNHRLILWRSFFSRTSSETKCQPTFPGKWIEARIEDCILMLSWELQSPKPGGKKEVKWRRKESNTS